MSLRSLITTSLAVAGAFARTACSDAPTEAVDHSAHMAELANSGRNGVEIEQTPG